MDVDNADCKLRVSQCTDMEISYIERPIKVHTQIFGLQQLVRSLRRLFSERRAAAAALRALLAAYTPDKLDWRRYAKFDRYRYTRNLVDEGDGMFNVMILCWGPSHASAIHDHADSHCFMKLLSGTLEEVRYKWPEHCEPEIVKKLKGKTPKRCCTDAQLNLANNNISEQDYFCQNESCHNFGGKMENGETGGDDAPRSMIETGRTRLEVNDVVYINDAIGLHRMENPSSSEGAVSLHVYCPPFSSCRVFEPRSGRAATAAVSYTTRYGRREHQEDIGATNIADTQN